MANLTHKDIQKPLPENTSEEIISVVEEVFSVAKKRALKAKVKKDVIETLKSTKIKRTSNKTASKKVVKDLVKNKSVNILENEINIEENIFASMSNIEKYAAKLLADKIFDSMGDVESFVAKSIKVVSLPKGETVLEKPQNHLDLKRSEEVENQEIYNKNQGFFASMFLKPNINELDLRERPTANSTAKTLKNSYSLEDRIMAFEKVEKKEDPNRRPFKIYTKASEIPLNTLSIKKAPKKSFFFGVEKTSLYTIMFLGIVIVSWFSYSYAYQNFIKKPNLSIADKVNLIAALPDPTKYRIYKIDKPDASIMKNEGFKDALMGDYVVAYLDGSKAIIYRESSNKIINILTINNAVEAKPVEKEITKIASTTKPIEKTTEKPLIIKKTTSSTTKKK